MYIRYMDSQWLIQACTLAIQWHHTKLCWSLQQMYWTLQYKFKDPAMPYWTDCNASMIYLHRWSCNNLAIMLATCRNASTCPWICSCRLNANVWHIALSLMHNNKYPLTHCDTLILRQQAEGQVRVRTVWVKSLLSLQL